MHVAHPVRLVGLCFLAIFVVLSSSPTKAQKNDAEAAFVQFIKSEKYRDADFYIESKLIDPKNLDISQIFYDIFKSNYWPQVSKNIARTDVLYNYLARFGPIDLNKTMQCRSNSNRCILANEILTGVEPETIKYFVDRGLDLNRRERGFVPTTVPLLARLGSRYSVEDMNFFVSNGLVLGDEVFPIEEIARHWDDYLYNDRLRMPENYLELKDQNLLDMAVIILGSDVSDNSVKRSLHRKTLCEFITYAAPSFQPSFDYLLYLLKVSDTFRGEYVGKTERDGNSIYQPFPNACVSLIQSMAASHAQLQTVISDFANRSDVQTAQWLISIQRGN